jgi:serine/threonine protein kinase
VGLGDEISVDYAEDMAMAGDCYVMLAGLDLAGHDAVLAGLGAAAAGDAPAEEQATLVLAALAAAPGDDKAAMVLRVLAAPAVDAAVTRAGLAALPLRPAPRQGDVWDGFRIGRTLYAGRYTMVVAARDTVEGRDVALKIPRPAMLQDEVFTAGFLREAWIGATARGAGVARYIELPPERRRSLYLVMPFYRGETLEARLHRAPPVGLPDGIGIALKLCAAVQGLAAIQVVHRDLKPDNVMLLERGEVRLLDLGLAYLPGIDMQDAVLPGGTLRYMAPELMRGVPANARSEVFALAVTIYRMFAGGAFPFGQREAAPLARLRPDLPGWLGQILKCALAPDPAARFADAGGLAAALREGLIAGTDDAAPPPRLTRLLVWQVLTALFALGFLVLLIRALR